MKRSSNQSNEWFEEKTGTLHTGHPPRVRVFLRSLAPPLGASEQQDGVLEQLESFERQGLFETVDVNIWGKSICPESIGARTDPGRQVMEQIEECSAWASNTDVSLDMPFEESDVSCSMTNEQYQKIVLPRVCLAIYANGELDLVLPCRIDGDYFGVEDFIASFKQRAPVEQGIETSA